MATYEVTAEIKTTVRLRVEAESPAEAEVQSDQLLRNDGFTMTVHCDAADDAWCPEHTIRIMRPKLLKGGE